MLTILGVNFGGESLGGGPSNPGETSLPNRRKNRLEEFAETFAGNFPKIRQTKIRDSTQIRSANLGIKRDAMLGAWQIIDLGG